MSIIWREALGPPECPYLIRWVLDFHYFSLRLHCWLHGDDPRYLHDHPWNFWSLVLYGQIYDCGTQGTVIRRAGDLNYFKADYAHTVNVYNPTWTLILTGPVIRPRWGFWVNGKFRKRNKFFFEHGHHNPCN